jgi:hypothetical protein
MDEKDVVFPEKKRHRTAAIPHANAELDVAARIIDDARKPCLSAAAASA